MPASVPSHRKILLVSRHCFHGRVGFSVAQRISPGKSTPACRALWVQRHARSLLKIFRLEPQVAGPVPSRGLLVSNHLGYLDILRARFHNARSVRCQARNQILAARRPAHADGRDAVRGPRPPRPGRPDERGNSGRAGPRRARGFISGRNQFQRQNGSAVQIVAARIGGAIHASTLGWRDSIHHRRRRRGRRRLLLGRPHLSSHICSICWASAPSAPPSALRRFNGPARTASNWRCNCARRF